MQHHLILAIQAVLIALLPVMANAEQNAVHEIDADEYAIYRVALQNLKGVIDVPNGGDVVLDATLSGRRLEADSIAHLARNGMAPDLAMVQDFNRKNRQKYRIAKGHLPPPIVLADDWKPIFPDGVQSVERLELSRVGFDKSREHALLIVTYTLRSKHDAYHHSGGYLMLRRSEDQWVVIGKVIGWSRFY